MDWTGDARLPLFRESRQSPFELLPCQSAVEKFMPIFYSGKGWFLQSGSRPKVAVFRVNGIKLKKICRRLSRKVMAVWMMAAVIESRTISKGLRMHSHFRSVFRQKISWRTGTNWNTLAWANQLAGFSAQRPEAVQVLKKFIYICGAIIFRLCSWKSKGTGRSCLKIKRVGIRWASGVRSRRICSAVSKPKATSAQVYFAFSNGY